MSSNTDGAEPGCRSSLLIVMSPSRGSCSGQAPVAIQPAVDRPGAAVEGQEPAELPVVQAAVRVDRVIDGPDLHELRGLPYLGVGGRPPRGRGRPRAVVGARALPAADWAAAPG